MKRPAGLDLRTKQGRKWKEENYGSAATPAKKPVRKATKKPVDVAAEAVEVVQLLTEIRDALHGSAERDHQHKKIDMLKEQLGHIKKMAETQEKLVETLILLTAKGITKAAKKEAVTPPPPAAPPLAAPAPTTQAIVEQANKNGKDIAAEQAAKEGAQAARDLLAAEVPKPAPALASVPTQDEARTFFLQYAQKHGREKAVDLLASFGAKMLSEVQPKDYPKFVETCRV